MRKSSGVHPFPEPASHESHASSSTPNTSDRESFTPSAETPDTGSLDSTVPTTQSMPLRPKISVPPLAATPSQQARPEHVETHMQHANHPQIVHQNHEIPDFSAELVGEPGPVIEEPLPFEYDSPYGSGMPPGMPQGSGESIPRPHSTNTLGSSSNSDPTRLSQPTHLAVGVESPSPSSSPMLQPQPYSPMRASTDNRPSSYIDLLKTPYAQQVAPAPNMDNSFLRRNVGSNAHLLETTKTLEMYRQNVKKTQDSAIQYEFAVFLTQAAMEMSTEAKNPSRAELLREARALFQRLADRSYPFAQYYLADGYASGLFNKGKEDYDHAFPLFVAASKRGHAEAAYRAALCSEFGWGCRKDYPKAVNYYKMAASKNHPGAATRLGLACLHDSMGLHGQLRQGVKWLKRAAESADMQYNAAPYELAKLHENGFGDEVFKDQEYAAQLFTQSANLGHADANLVMGKAYEHGLLGCPQDPGVSIHFYTAAAEAGECEAMMALCAWYLFGAPPVLDKDENEAFEWAKRAAECGGYSCVGAVLDELTETSVREGGIRRRVLQGGGHRVQAGRARGQHVVLAGGAAGRGAGQAAHGGDPPGGVRGRAGGGGGRGQVEEGPVLETGAVVGGRQLRLCRSQG
jgi:TPR repeat protein